MTTDSYYRWRRIHIGSSGLVAVLAIVHAAVSGLAFAHGSRDVGRSVGAALALLLLSGLNIAHIGLEQCRQPTARFVRGANWIFVILGAATIVAVPVPVRRQGKTYLGRHLP